MNAIAPGSNAGPPQLALPPAMRDYLRALDAYHDERARFAAAREAVNEGKMPAKMLEGLYVGSPPKPPALSDADRVSLVGQVEAQLDAISLHSLRAWLAPINAACRNPQSRDDFDIRSMGIHMLVNDLPAGAFTDKARRKLGEFFPSASDVREAVLPAAEKLRAIHRALTMKPEKKPDAEPERGPRSMDEILAVRAKAAEARAVLRAAEEPPEMKPVQPRYLSPGQLLRVYEQLAKEGNQAAAMRAAAIRKQIEAAA